MRAAFEKGLPLVYLQENGFTDLAKPNGMRMDACARGHLPPLAPVRRSTCGYSRGAVLWQADSAPCASRSTQAGCRLTGSYRSLGQSIHARSDTPYECFQ